MIDSIKLVTSIAEIPVCADRWQRQRRNARGRRIDGYALDCGAFDPAVRRVSVFLDPRHRELSIEGSLPTVLHGYNVREIVEDDVQTIVGKLDALIRWGL